MGNILIVLILLGAFLYIVDLLKIDVTVKRIIQVVVIVIAVCWLISLFFPGATAFPHLRR